MNKPVYTEDRKARIAYVANDQWACQVLHRELDSDGRPIFSARHDPWYNTHRPTTKAEAIRQLLGFGKVLDVSV